MSRHTLVLSLYLGAAVPALGAEVWRSTFDTNADGVVDVRDDNTSGKVMIGSNTGGRLEIVTQDTSGTSGVSTADKAGRSLGGSVFATDSFGGYFKWHYTGYDVSTGGAAAEEVAGFVSDASPHSTRQVLGAALIHFKNEAGDHMIRFGARWASVGYSYSGYEFDPSIGPTDINLGPNVPIGTEFQICMGYDGSSETFTTGLYDGGGNLLKEVSQGLRFFDNLGFAPDSNEVNNEVNSLELKYLGWSDFYNTATNLPTKTWAVDDLAYFDDATGACAAIVPEPASGLLLLVSGVGGLMLQIRRRPYRRP